MRIPRFAHLPHLPPISLRVLVSLLIILLGAQLYLANKSWRTYQVLAGARSLGVEQAAQLRAYTSVDELLTRYGISEAALLDLLKTNKLPDARTKVKSLAQALELDELAFIVQLQSLVPVQTTEGLQTELTLYQRFEQQVLEWLEAYGLIVLVVIVFLGALGMPVPAGPLAALTGVLSFEGLMSGIPTALTILAAAVAGDLLVYLLGCKTDDAKLVRYGRLVGYTEANRLRVLHLFERWGGLTLLLTRSLVAHISAVASLLAGSAGTSLKLFLSYAVLGRAAWLFIYFGLGYLVGSDFDMASSFLGYLSLLLIALLMMGVLIEHYYKQRRARQLPEQRA